MNNCVLCNGNGWYVVRGLEGVCRCQLCNSDGMMKPPADGVILRECDIASFTDTVAISVANIGDAEKVYDLRKVVKNYKKDLETNIDFSAFVCTNTIPLTSNPLKIHLDCQEIELNTNNVKIVLDSDKLSRELETCDYIEINGFVFRKER